MPPLLYPSPNAICDQDNSGSSWIITQFLYCKNICKREVKIKILFLVKSLHL